MSLTTKPIKRERATTKPRKANGTPLVDAKDVLATCRVAANLALQGETYSEHDRADTTAALVLLVMERAKDDPETLRATPGGYPMDLYPARLIGMDFLVHRAANERRKLTTSRERQLEDRAASDTWTPETAPTGKLSVHGSAAAEDASPINDGTAHGARMTALAMLADAGLWEGSRSGKLAPTVHDDWTPAPTTFAATRNLRQAHERTGAQRDRMHGTDGRLVYRVNPREYPQGCLFDERRDLSTVRASAPTGPLWTLAYTLARVAGCAMDTDGNLINNAAVAAELELKPSAHKMQLKRGAELLAAQLERNLGVRADDDGNAVDLDPLRAWVDALNIDGMSWEAPETPQGMDARTTQKHVDAEVTTKPVAKRTKDRGSDWSRIAHPPVQGRWNDGRYPVNPVTDGRPTVGGPQRPIDPLRPLKRKALEKATAMRRARLAGMDTDARNAARLAAGLPPITD